MNVWDVRLAGRASFHLPDGHTLAAVVLKGAVEVNGETAAREGEVAIFDRHGGEIALAADGEAKLLILGGEPIDEPVVSYGPFVMNTADEIRAAINDYHSGRFGRMAAA
jgi:hypothetical protein